MILSMRMHNVALIEDLQLDFASGMHVMTGETGAGKSIVVDAVNLVLGGRADRDLIRTGTEKAWVEAVFDPQNNRNVAAFLSEQQLESDGIVTLYRRIDFDESRVRRIKPCVPFKKLGNDHFFHL